MKIQFKSCVNIVFFSTSYHDIMTHGTEYEKNYFIFTGWEDEFRWRNENYIVNNINE